MSRDPHLARVEHAVELSLALDVLAFHMLGRDDLTRDRGQERMKQVARLLPIAEELGTSPSRLALAWCLLNERVSSVILGASRVEQLEDNLKAGEVLPLLTDEIRAKLAAL